MSVSNQVAGDARLAHARYQMEVSGSAPAFTGYTELCAECAVDVRKAVVQVYLQRRKNAPENVEQLEDLEYRNQQLEARRIEERDRRAAVEWENANLKKQVLEHEKYLEREAIAMQNRLSALESRKNKLLGSGVDTGASEHLRETREWASGNTQEEVVQAELEPDGSEPLKESRETPVADAVQAEIKDGPVVAKRRAWVPD